MHECKEALDLVVCSGDLPSAKTGANCWEQHYWILVLILPGESKKSIHI